MERGSGAPQFVANQGQWPEAVRFVAVGGHTAAWVTDRGVTLRLERRAGERREGAVVRLEVAGADPEAVIAEGAPAASATHVLVGGGRGGSGRAHERVRLVEVRPGIDLVLRPDPDGGALCYDFHLAAGADLDDLVITCAGAEVGSPDHDGTLTLQVPLPGGERVTLRQRPPVAWEELERGVRRPLDVRFERRGADRFGFVAANRDRRAALVVDPGLDWSTFLGGGASDSGLCIAHAPGLGVYVGGWAGSLDFPTTAGAFRETGGRDAWVARLSEDGARLVWSTYFGGTGIEDIRGLAIAPDGDVVIGGFTSSDDFPVTAGAFQTEFAGGSVISDLGDGFVARLSGDGASLRWATYLGAAGDDFVEAVHVAPSGQVTVAGQTDASDFPTTPGAAQETFGSISALAPDAFVTRLTADGSAAVWSTYFGAGGQELLGGMSVDDVGRVAIGGLTASTPPPTRPDAWSPLTTDPWNGFIAVLSADASRFEVATLAGIHTYDRVEDVGFAPDGSLWAVGVAATGSPSLATGERAWQREPAGNEDAFVLRLSPDGRSLRAATFLGGSGDDVATSAAVAADGGLWVVGSTSSTDLPIVGASDQPDYGGGPRDGFIARLDADLMEVRALGWLGGADKDRLFGVAATGEDSVVAVGTTFSADLAHPVTAPQATFGGVSDAWVLSSSAPVADPIVDVDQILSTGTSRFEAGDTVVGTTFTFRNDGGDAVDVEAVTFVLGGVTVRSRDFASLSVYVDLDADGQLDPGEPRVGGPETIVDETPSIRVPVVGTGVSAAGSLALLGVIETRATCSPESELVLGVPDASGIEIRARTGARRVMVAGAGMPLRGKTWFCERRREYDGDLDGDGASNCRDVRWLSGLLGSATGDDAQADADGDGNLDGRDVDLLFDRILLRQLIWLPQSGIESGGVLEVRGFELPVELAATLDGAALKPLLIDERSSLFAVPDVLNADAVTIRVTDGGGGELFRGELPVQ